MKNPTLAGGVLYRGMAERTGLEPATSNVTGWRSNQLSYRSIPVRVARKLGGDLPVCNTYFAKNENFFNSGKGLDGGFE